MLNDLFARNLTHNLAAWLRTRFQVNLVSAEQIPFNEFLLRIPEISYVASVRLEPLGALSVLQLDLALAPPIIDLLLGGEGKDGPLREVTDIEESILASVVEIICRELTAAWQPVGLSFNFERRQMQTQVARHYVSHRKNSLSELRDSHAAQFGAAESGISRGGIEHHSAPADLRLGHGAGDTLRDAMARMESLASASALAALCSCPRSACGPALLRALEPGTSCAWISANTLPIGGWAGSHWRRPRLSGRARTARRGLKRDSREATR